MDTVAAAPREAVEERPVRSEPPRRRGGTLISIIVAAVVAALVAALTTVGLVNGTGAGRAAAAAQPAPQQAPVSTGGGGSNWAAAIAKQVGPSVGKVDVTSQQGQGEGSAVIFRANGYLLTNNHVIDQASKVTVTLPNGKHYPATVVGTDAATDLAVIKIDAKNLPVATRASRTPQIGDQVLAIGTPFGLSGTVTEGIISAKGRTVPEPTTALTNMLQTDAAVNPGNSGGALVNTAGQVVGINTAILSPSGTNNGIGFAIPITSAHAIARQLIAHGTIQHGYLGIGGQTVDPQIASNYNLGVDHGAVVVQVQSGSPAASAGLRQGDIITGVDRHKVTSMEDLVAALVRDKPGDKVTLDVFRQGSRTQMSVTLGKTPPEAQTSPAQAPAAP